MPRPEPAPTVELPPPRRSLRWELIAGIGWLVAVFGVVAAIAIVKANPPGDGPYRPALIFLAVGVVGGVVATLVWYRRVRPSTLPVARVLDAPRSNLR